MKKGLKRILSTVLASAMLFSSMTVVNTSSVFAAGTITAESVGWHETAYTEWLPVEGADSYEAYVKKTSDSEYTKLDDELVREYDTFVRADALGLAKGTYNMKIVALNSSGVEIASYESGAITVDNYIRDGFAFSDNGSSSGAYNDDGTLKDEAVVIYVTDENKDTITMDITTSNKGATTACTGLGEIIKALEKGYETTPLDFRFIGQVSCPDSTQSLNQLDVKKAECPITFEGVGNDAFALFGFNLVSANNVEIRNLGFKDMTTKDEDGVTIKSQSKRIWVHNCDFFYGGQGSDSDQAKGDGSVDLKNTSTKITISDNHYWDSGKVNLCGLSESTDYEISYARNWFDHSDSRHPRVRTGSIHVYNNYYDGVSKYGVGACTGSSVFVEGNYFRNTSKPVMSSKQGTDAQGSGTFSGEAGGIIKMYDNIMTGTYTFIEANNGDGTYNQDSDGYTVSSRDETVPSGLTTVKGDTSYNNFDTERDLGVDASGVLAASDVPAYVTANAGRIDGGNFMYIFDDATEDSNYDVIDEMTDALADYTYGANTAYVSSMSATGIDDNTFYTARATAYEKHTTLPTETETDGNSATGGGSVSGSADLVLNYSDVSTGTYSSTVTDLGTDGAFAIYATSGKTVTVSSSKGIQLGGAGSVTDMYRLISVTVSEAGTIYVTSSSTGSDTRTLNIADEEGNIIGTISTGSSSGVELPSAGTYYIYSAGSGINVTKVSVYYNDDSDDDDTETTTSSGSSSGSGDATTSTTTETTTSTTTEATTEATTSSGAESSTEATTETTTETVTEAPTESTTSTVVVPDDGYAAEGTYMLGQNASGGDFNITTKTATEGNVYFKMSNIQSNAGRIKTEEDGYYISFELDRDAYITINVTNQRDPAQIREYGETTIAGIYPANAVTTCLIPAGSYVIEYYEDPNLDEDSSSQGVTEIASIVISYSVSSSDDDSSSTTTTETTTEITTETTTETTTSGDTGSGSDSEDYKIITSDTELSADNFDNNEYFAASDSTNVYKHSTNGCIRLKSAGTITFKIAAGATVKITASGANADDSTRTLTLSNDSGYSNTVTLNNKTDGATESTYGTDLAAGTYTLKSSNDVDITSISVTFTSESEPTVTKGDANGDGSVTIDDVKHILNYVVGLISSVVNEEAADVNEDGSVTSRDAYIIQYFIKNETWKTA